MLHKQFFFHVPRKLIHVAFSQGVKNRASASCYWRKQLFHAQGCSDIFAVPQVIQSSSTHGSIWVTITTKTTTSVSTVRTWIRRWSCLATCATCSMMRVSGVTSPKTFWRQMFDFRQATVFSLELCLSKHKMTTNAKNFGGMPPCPPCYVYDASVRLMTAWNKRTSIFLSWKLITASASVTTSSFVSF